MASSVASSCAASSLCGSTSQRSCALTRGTILASRERSISHSGCGYEPTRVVESNLLRLLVRVDQITRLVLRRIEDHLSGKITKIVDAVALDVLELDQQHPLRGPLALGAELHVPDDGLECCFAQIIGKLLIIEALGCADGIAEHLEIGLGPLRHVIAERFHSIGGRP